MKKLIYCFLLSLLPFSLVRGQEIIEHKGDTMIVMSPKNLKTINSIIIDLESSKEIIKTQKDIIINDSLTIIDKDSIISYQWSMMEKKDDYYINSVKNLENSLKKEKRKRTFWTSTLGCVAVILGIISISK